MKRLALLAALVLGLLASSVSAQTPTPPSTSTPGDTAAPPGVISGSVVMGSAGATLEGDLAVEIIVLTGEQVTGTVTAPVVDGAYSADVVADLNRTYVPRLVYQGLNYFADPVILAPVETQATRDFAVYATTSQAPALAIALTIVTVVAIDRGAGELGVLREDLVTNPSDRTFTGDEQGVTLRVPAPDGTLEAIGEQMGDLTFEGGIVPSVTPIVALTDSSVITRFVVGYDPAEDAYVMRVTAPLPTDRIVVRVPEHYARALQPEGEAVDGGPDTFAVEGAEPARLRTVVLENVEPGESLVVRLDGLTPEVNDNVLTDQPGAIVAALAALAIIGSASVVLLRRPRAT